MKLILDFYFLKIKKKAESDNAGKKLSNENCLRRRELSSEASSSPAPPIPHSKRMLTTLSFKLFLSKVCQKLCPGYSSEDTGPAKRLLSSQFLTVIGFYPFFWGFLFVGRKFFLRDGNFVFRIFFSLLSMFAFCWWDFLRIAIGLLSFFFPNTFEKLKNLSLGLKFEIIVRCFSKDYRENY